jgi:hypothetical protein
MTAPDGFVVTVSKPRRSGPQNDLLHALLTEVAATQQWAGSKWPLETWKRLLTGAWMRAEGKSLQMLPALDGQGIEVIYQRTSELSKSECSSLIDYIQAWLATIQAEK